MATVEKAHGVADHGVADKQAGKPTNQAEAAKAVNKATGHGPDGTLTENQLSRAASEYMVALRAQPTPPVMEEVLIKIVEVDEHGKLKHQCKSTDEVPALVDAALSEAAQPKK
jgi:hypothetical protein